MSNRPYRIVIIEDNPEDRAIYRRRLAQGREQDYQFWETGSGEEGLRLCRDVTPDCVMLDYQLPDLDGLEFLDRFQAEVGHADISIIMLTGQGNEAVAVQAMKKGAHDYLIKGLNSDNLRQAIQSAIDKGIMRRQIEEQRRELESLSAERVRLIADLKEQAAALAEANRRKDEFLATLAHELRNPLAPIRNALHFLRMSGDSGRVHEMMERQVKHLVRLVDDLLEVSRITRGKIELRRERVELAAVVGSAVETSRPLIEASGHQLVIALPPEPLILEADPVRLAQVIANLLNNAAKYTEPAGQIRLAARREDGEAVVSVQDSGLGIPADMLARVFDMFAQVDRTLKRAQGGLGIGLTLARNLVELHGGSIAVQSDGPGKGSEFTVRLPLTLRKSGALEVQPLDDRPRPVDRHPRRILVVDDNHDAADSIGMILRFVGVEVHVVYDGPAALAALRTYRPAVILLDIGMPGMDGHEVAHRVRQDPEFRDLVLIALTGWGQEEDRRRCKAAGFDHHLVKPVDVETLQSLLASLDRAS
jgi:signal transduction histidine kinase